jgi:hypothetical protein
MSRKHQASVMPQELDHQERGLELVERDPGLAAPARIAALKAARPTSPLGCVACYHRGLDAVLAEMGPSGAAGEVPGRLELLRATHPKDKVPHDAASYHRGVEAALDALER